jgi:hypothetical protein
MKSMTIEELANLKKEAEQKILDVIGEQILRFPKEIRIEDFNFTTAKLSTDSGEKRLVIIRFEFKIGLNSSN